MKSLYVKTPLIPSYEMSNYCNGQQVLLKLENCQPSGSFKLRGISKFCQHALEYGYEKIVCSSGGNAGLSAAYAARKLGLKCEIIVPKTTSQVMREKIQSEGATLEIFGDAWYQANIHAAQVAKESNGKSLYLHPFDHPLVWNGHSTIVDEIANELDHAPSLIATCCGGGGLICGLVEGLRRHRWTSVPILAMETIGAEGFHAAIKAGNVPVRLSSIDSIASSLGADFVCEQLLKEYQLGSPAILPHLVADKDAVDACLKFANHHNMIVEPACGATLSSVYTGLVARLLKENKITNKGPIVVIVCGGRTINFDGLLALRKQYEL